MHEGAEWKTNRKTEKIDPGRQRWEKQPEKYEIQAGYHEERRHPWLEDAYTLLGENYVQARELWEDELYYFLCDYLTYFFIMNL
jgi:hypothetical protein